MKPVISRTFFVQNFLTTLAALFFVTGLIFFQKTVTVIPTSFGSLTEGAVQVPLYLGVIPLPFLMGFLSFLFIYLIFEFYGFKPAFYTAASQGITGLFCLVILYVIKHFTLDPLTSSYDEMLMNFLTYDKRQMVVLILSFLVGNTITLSLAGILKKLMRNYFMFLRFPLAAGTGLTLCAWTSVYLNNRDTLALRSMYILAVPAVMQFFALVLIAVIPLYILRLFLGLFRGWSQTEDRQEAGSKSLFKGQEPAPAAESLPEENTDKNRLKLAKTHD